MDSALLSELEVAIRGRNPALAGSLLPALPESEVRSLLRQANAAGDLAALVSLYGWHNGTSDTPPLHLPDSAILPGTSYSFPTLRAATEHFLTLRTAAADLLKFTQDPTNIGQGAGSYFPVFWDGVTGYLAVDLTEASNNRVFIVEFEAEKPYCQAYQRFEDFIADAIRVNKTNGTLACFRSR